MTAGQAVVELRGVWRTFPGSPPIHAVRSVDLSMRSGDYLSIVGPSGSGKSTLLHLLGLLDRPTAGTYRLDGDDTATLSERDRARVRGARIGFVFQAFHLLEHRSVQENVMLALLYSHGAVATTSRVGRRERQDRAAAALDQVGLSRRASFLPTALSGGERQRVAIARALVSEPSLLLADEPTGNLDQATSGSIMDLVDDLHAAGMTLAVITHDVRVSQRATRRVRIVDGHLDEPT